MSLNKPNMAIPFIQGVPASIVSPIWYRYLADLTGTTKRTAVAGDLAAADDLYIEDGASADVLALLSQNSDDSAILDVFSGLDASSGGSMGMFMQQGTGAVSRTFQDKDQELISVKDYGAKGDGLTDDTAAFQAAYNYAPAGAVIKIPRGTYAGANNAVTGTKVVIWDALGALPVGATYWTLPGVVLDNQGSYFAGTITGRRSQTGPYDPSVAYFERILSHSGGTAGWVVPTFSAYTKTTAGALSFEWTVVGVLDNYAGAGENVAGYFQGNKRGVGPTWGAVAQVQDLYSVNPTTGVVGIEVDINASGGDSNNCRIGVDVVGCLNPGGSTPTIYAGLRVGPQNGVTSNGQFANGLLLTGVMTRGVNLTGSFTVGVDTSLSTLTGPSFRCADGTTIAFDATSSYQLRHNTTGSGVSGLTYSVGGVDKVILADNGGVVVSNPIAYPGSITNTSATAGGASGLPATPAGYLQITVAGTTQRVPYYN